MSACRNLLCERVPFTPNDNVRRCNSLRNSAHVHLLTSISLARVLPGTEARVCKETLHRQTATFLVKSLACRGCKKNAGQLELTNRPFSISFLAKFEDSRRLT